MGLSIYLGEASLSRLFAFKQFIIQVVNSFSMTNEIPKIENKNWQNQIVQSINEGICVVTKENLISFVNPAAARILDWKIE